MLFKSISILWKNILVLKNSKLSALIILIGPVLLILLLGLALGNTSLKNIQTNLYVEQNTTFSNQFKEELVKNSFIIQDTNTLEDCLSGVRKKEKVLCIEIKNQSDFSFPNLDSTNIQVDKISASDFQNSINLHLDFSRQRIVWGVISKVDAIVNSFSQKLRKNALDELSKEVLDLEGTAKSNKAIVKVSSASLTNIKSNIRNFQKDLEEDRKNLNNSFKKLESSIDEVDDLYKAPDSIIFPVFVAFDKLKEGWTNFTENQNTKILENSNTDINRIENNLKIVERELSEVQQVFEELRSQDLDKEFNPIPLFYTSISEGISKKSASQPQFLDYLFPSFLSLFIAFISITLGATIVVRERISGAYIREIMSKTSDFTQILGRFLTVFFIVLIQILIILIISSFFLTIPLFSNIGSLIVSIIVSIAVFVSMGMILGYIFDSQETAILGAVSLSILLVLFSSLISPLETLPDLTRSIFSFSPLILLEKLLGRILLLETGLGTKSLELIVLGVTFIISFIILMGLYKIKKRGEII